jgi:3-phosphoshikimate 1-carboxyvinyltransferase
MKKNILPGEVKITMIAPAAKSIAIRAVAAAVLELYFNNERPSISIRNYPQCTDAIAALDVVNALGFKTTLDALSTLSICKNDVPNQTQIVANCKESALCYRMFQFVALAMNKNATFQTEGTLQSRIKDEASTAEFRNDGVYDIDCSHSSQALSGLLMTLPCCDSNSVVTATIPYSYNYVTLTLSILEQFGIAIECSQIEPHKYRFVIEGNQKYHIPNDYMIEGDWSAASNFFVLGATAGDVTIANLNANSKQPDVAILRLFHDLHISCSEISPSVFRTIKSKYSGFDFDATDCPDLIPPLVVLALGANSNSRIFGIERLQNKESNRAADLLKIFSMFGIRIQTRDNAFIVQSGKISGGFADSHSDHRIAMAVAIAAKAGHKPVILTRADAVNKTFPDFWNCLV